MEEATLLLCGSVRNVHGKTVKCSLRYHHSALILHKGVTAGGYEIEWDGAASVDIVPRHETVPA